MTQIPAGWYPDPGTPDGSQQRYWEGSRWTEHTAPVAPTAHQTAYPAAYAQPTGRATHTPDGAPLAGWWQRVLASVIDGVVLAPIVAVLAWPWVSDVIQAYGDYFDDVQRAADNGTAQPSAFDLSNQLAGPFAAIGLVGLVVNLVWTFGWLRWRSATPGKLVVGLRVRRRLEPGPLGWGTIGKRWLVQYGVGAIGLIPFIGGIASMFSLLDGLWPLWDAKRQALHDKWADTNVVRKQ